MNWIEWMFRHQKSFDDLIFVTTSPFQADFATATRTSSNTSIFVKFSLFNFFITYVSASSYVACFLDEVRGTKKAFSRYPVFKVGLSPSKKSCYLPWKPFKNDKNCFFCSQYIEGFLMAFCSCRKNGLIRKIGLISKFITSQPG